jgi:hypothetical protein
MFLLNSTVYPKDTAIQHSRIYIYISTVLCWTLACLFSFLIFYIVGRTPWTGDQSVAMPLPAHRTAQTQTSMPQVGFEPTIPMFQRAKTVYALDRGATLMGQPRRLIKSYFIYASTGNKLKVLNYFNSFQRQSMKTKI